MKLSKLIAVKKDVEVTGISVDSRMLKKGDLFICLEGDHYDGHAYAVEAVNKGAVAVVCRHSLGLENEILVEDTRLAAAKIYSAWFDYPQKKMKIFGVTGTNGKTSIVNLLKRIYHRAGFQTAVSGTLGSFWQHKAVAGENTTARPEQLYEIMHDMVADGSQVLFMEVSSHALALNRVSEIQFAYGIYTNLTPDHLDFHKTMEAYAAAKARLFEQSQVGIFNFDDAHSYYAAHHCPCRAYGYGLHAESDFRVCEIMKNDLTGISYRVKKDNTVFSVESPLPGDFNISNTLAAASAAIVDGVPVPVVTEAIASFYGAPGRMECVYHGAFSIFIDYAHTPDALARALGVLKAAQQKEKTTAAPGRLRVLFGCGGDRDKTKRPVMGEIAATMADEVIVTGDNARTEDPSGILNDIVSGIRRLPTAAPYVVIPDRRDALAYAVASARLGDVILAAGKGHENYEIDASGKHPFSEKDIIRACLAERNDLES